LADAHKNFASSLVATAPSPASSGTSLVVTAADGAKFPAVPFNATIWPASAQPTTANAEIVRVTGISTDTFTITRAQESSSARTVVIGDQIAATITAKTLTDVELNVYVTTADQTIPATTEVIFESYLELSASFFYELSADAILVIGDFATPLPVADQNPNIFITVADETIPRNSEVIFSDYYELSAPFVNEISVGALLQLGTTPDIVSASPFLPGYEIGYDQITSTVNIVSLTESAGTTIISCAPHYFDGLPVMVEFFTNVNKTPASGANSEVLVSLFEGATQVSRLSVMSMSNGSVSANIFMSGRYRFTPTAGWHVYTVSAIVDATTGTPFILGASGGTGGYAPCFIRFTKV
jgi:hypothetical protein